MSVLKLNNGQDFVLLVYLARLLSGEFSYLYTCNSTVSSIFFRLSVFLCPVSVSSIFVVVSNLIVNMNHHSYMYEYQCFLHFMIMLI